MGYTVGINSILQRRVHRQLRCSTEDATGFWDTGNGCIASSLLRLLQVIVGCCKGL